MDGLTEEQMRRLDALLEHLETFPTPELIAVSGKLRCPRPLDEQGKARMRMALAGAFAFVKIMSYLEVLRKVDAERDRVGREIYALRQQVRSLQGTDPLAAVEPQTRAVHLSGIQEVTFHFYAICVSRVARLMPLVNQAVGQKILAADMAVLTSYKPLRDYFEHLEDRAPGKSRQAEVVSERQDAEAWRVIVGLESDTLGRVFIHGQPIDVTTRGLGEVQDAVERIYLHLRPSCLEQVRKHFLDHPEDIPSPEAVPFEPLVSLDKKWEE